MKLEHVTLEAVNDNEPNEFLALKRMRDAYIKKIQSVISLDPSLLAVERNRVAQSKVRFEKLVEEHPKNEDFQKGLSISTMNLRVLMEHYPKNLE
jgi:uncharacterized protein YigA (DUF484 family)